MKIYQNTEYPKRETDLKGHQESFSVDVICCDDTGLLNICFWDYDTKRWGFLADTLTDPYEKGDLVKFVWMYKPEELKVEEIKTN